MKAPIFSAFVPQVKEDTAWALSRVAELAAEQADEWTCGACYGSGYCPINDYCRTCGGTGTQQRWRDPADYDSHDYD
jgi:RecJ-like exonuclease